ncbi:MAG: tRNA pseudouridine(55) synthase TruB [Sutterella sp.]|nr:tRNA pseudouridine(55) synthase TruB [Sutterella sp.]
MGSKGEAVDGVLLLDKPESMSSNWALQLSRRLLNAQKAGHTGTLDPMATGLLPLAFGNATKFSADLLKADKRYIARMKFGKRTDTLDKTGVVTQTSDVRPTVDEIEALIPEFTGVILQRPPMYSAIKRDGKNLYELARRGIEVTREARQVCVKRLTLISYEDGELTFETDVSKGTYIRVLADDMAMRLGTCAHLTALRRTRVGDLSIDDAVPFSELDDKTKSIEQRRKLLKGADFLLQSLPALNLTELLASRLENGQRLAIRQDLRGQARAYGPGKRLLGVVRVDEHGVVHPVRLITFLGNTETNSGKKTL